MRIRAWIWLLLLAAMAAFSAVRILQGRAIQTDLLAMLPETEHRPAAEIALRQLAQAGGERAIFMVGHREPDRARDQAFAFADTLAQSGAFAHVLGRLPAVDPTMVARFYAPHRFRLPSGGELPDDVASRIQNRLTSLQGTVGGFGAAQDPLGEGDAFLANLPLASSRLQLAGDALAVPTEDMLYVLVTATLKGSAFDPDIQRRTMQAIRQAEGGLGPDTTLLRTGTLFYAEEARRQAEHEMNLLSTASLVGILALFMGVFRSLRHLLLGTLGIAAGILLATTLSLLLFGRLYLLTLACGASVLGVAVDYSFLYFARHLGEADGWEPRKALRAILLPLTLGFVTSALGYAALAVPPFPGLRQIAVFSLLGLIGALLTVTLVMPDLLPRPARPQPWLVTQAAAWMRRLTAAARHPIIPIGALAMAVVLALGAWRLRVDDDALALIQPPGPLRAQEARIQALAGLSNHGAFLLVEGQDEAEVLQREEALRTHLGGLPHQAVSQFVPSPACQTATLNRWQHQAPRITNAMHQSGFRPDVILGWQRDLAQAAEYSLTVADWHAQPFSIPFHMLWIGRTPQGCASVVLPLGPEADAKLRAIAAQVPGVSYVHKAASVGRLLGRSRVVASGALAAACLLVWGLLALRYGIKGGFWVLAPALLGILAALGGTGFLGLPLTLFGVMGLILILGFSVDYTIFLREGRDGSALVGVLLASLSTLISFGVLVFSHTPILRSFGLTIALGVLGSLLTTFIALRDGHGKEPA